MLKSCMTQPQLGRSFVGLNEEIDDNGITGMLATTGRSLVVMQTNANATILTQWRQMNDTCNQAARLAALKSAPQAYIDGSWPEEQLFFLYGTALVT